MNNALRICQRQHDDAEPSCTDAFIDTAEGQNWLAGAADELIEDSLYIAGKRVTEQVAELERQLADHVGGKWRDGNDYDGVLGQVIRHVYAGNQDMARSALRLLISDKEVRDMADDLVAPLAQQYADSRQDEDFD